jgi:uncharacterized protein YcbK (DUF882 family)
MTNLDMTFSADASVERRTFLRTGLTLSMSALLSVGAIKPALALPTGGEYRVHLKNSHTNEIFSGTYRVGNKYLPQAFERINYVLRDFRANEVFPIDPRAIDIIAIVHKMTGKSDPYSVLSGYRNAKTNAMLRSHGDGVAKHSLHMSGQAIDVRMEDVSPARIRDLATKLKAGGVGYYPRSGFVHMDSGSFRTWG